MTKTAADPAWRTRIRRPAWLVEPISVKFELPPPIPLWAPVVMAWKGLPALLRAGLAGLALFAGVSLSVWALAGEAIGEQIQLRAAVEISEEFHGGFNAWMGARDWAQTWSRNPAGYVQVGQLALLRPTRTLSDYQFEFLAQMTGKSLGWAYRAGDLENYYAMKLAVLKPGPIPSVALVRYVVVGGREQQRVQVPVRVVLHSNTAVRIRLVAKGDGFTTWISDRMVDFWRDDRFQRGGIGFFAEPDDRPHIYWIRITHQNDFLGKLCAYLAPSHMEVPNR